MKKVSAVITTHKREPRMVERALKSILSQTHPDVEVFVVDDSPADYELRPLVAEMVKGYAAKGVRYIQHESCKGACAARNTGLAAATGEYIGFLDDDDEWLPEKIEKMLPGFDSDKVALVYCARYCVWMASGNVERAEHGEYVGKVFDKLILNNFIGSTSFPLLRTDILRQIGGFDTEMPASQDFDVWLRIAKDYEVNYVDIPLVRYYVHAGEQITKNPMKKIIGLERVCEKHAAYLKKNRKARAVTYLNLCQPYSSATLFGKAIWMFVKALALYPTCGKRMIPPLKAIVYNILHKRRKKGIVTESKKKERI